MSVGNNIKKIRNKLGLTQKELSEKCSLSESAIKYYEINKRNPKIETLNKIAAALQVNLDTLTCSESFEHEILSRAIQLTFKSPAYDGDVFMVLGWYADYDLLTDFYIGKSTILPITCLKGLLHFIIDNSISEFNKIYNDLIETDIYDLDSDFKSYCKNLYEKGNNPLDYISEKNKTFLEHAGLLKDGQLDGAVQFYKNSNNIKSIVKDNKVALIPSLNEELMHFTKALTLGENIEHYRISRNITKKYLSEQISVSESTLTDYENNICSPDLNVIIKIANVLQCAPLELMPLEILNHYLNKSKKEYSAIEDTHIKKFLIELKEMLDNYFLLDNSNISIFDKVEDLISYESYKLKEMDKEDINPASNLRHPPQR